MGEAIITTYEPEPGWSIHDKDETWVKLSGGRWKLGTEPYKVYSSLGSSTGDSDAANDCLTNFKFW